MTAHYPDATAESPQAALGKNLAALAEEARAAAEWLDMLADEAVAPTVPASGYARLASTAGTVVAGLLTSAAFQDLAYSAADADADAAVAAYEEGAAVPPF